MQLEQPQPGLDDPAAGVEERVVPEPELVAGRRLLADRAQQAVALLERAAVGREVVGVGREVGGGQRVDGRAPQRRRADDQQHLLGREQHDPQVPPETARAPAQRR